MRVRNALIFGLVLLVLGCAPRDPLVGEWTANASPPFTYTFKSDGTFSMDFKQNLYPRRDSGTWKLVGDELQLVMLESKFEGADPSKENMASRQRLQWVGKNQLVLSDTVYGTRVTLTRGKHASINPKVDSPVVKDNTRSIMDQVHPVLKKIDEDHVFDEKSQALATSWFWDERTTVFADGGLLLTAAVRKGLFPKERAFALFEEKLVKTKGHSKLLVLRMFEGVLGLPSSENDKLLEREHMTVWGHLSGTPFKPSEKEFVEETLADQNASNRRLAASLLVQAEEMQGADSAWALEKVDGQIKSATGNEKRFWSAVRASIVGRVLPSN